MELWKALAYLYPGARSLIDYEIQQVAGGVPFIAAWNLPDPQPTETEIANAILAYDAAKAQADTDTVALRTKVRTLAQGTVGIAVDQLTAQQVRALFAILLWKEGALTKDGLIRPIIEWLRD